MVGGGLHGHLATLAAARVRALLDEPGDPRRQADQVEALAYRLRDIARLRLRDDLVTLAKWGHAAAAKTLTRQAKRRPVREDLWVPELDDYDDWIIPAPTADLLRLLVGPAPDRLTMLVDPRRAADLVYSGVAGGKDRKAIAKDLVELFDGFGVSARRVARTEGLRVATETQLAASESIADMIAGYTVYATLDGTTRPEHRKRDGTTYWRDPRPGQLGFDRMPRPPYDADGTLCYNCVLPDQLVQGRLRSGFRATYSGQAVEIRLRSGVRLAVTVNHPVLAANGFVAAGSLRPGDEVITHRPDQERTNVRGHDDEAPASAENAFRALEAAGLGVRPVAVAAFDLDGDERLFEGDIEVVKLDGLLRPCGDPSVSESAQQETFIFADDSGSRPVEFVPLRRAQPRGVGLATLPFGAEPGPLDTLGLGMAPLRNTRIPEPFVDHGASHAERNADGGRRFPSTIPGNNGVDSVASSGGRVGGPVRADGNASGDQLLPERFALHADFTSKSGQIFTRNIPADDAVESRNRPGRRFGVAAEMDTSLHQFTAEGSVGHARFVRELVDGFSGRVAADQVIEVRHFHYHGPVYDFETDHGYFTASSPSTESQCSVILRNCRCTLVPRFHGE